MILAMKHIYIISLLGSVVMIMCCDSKSCNKDYVPNWKSLDTRPLPEWYHQAKIGILVHWGVFSVPSFKSEWFWKLWRNGSSSIDKFMKQNFPPDFTYHDFGPLFRAELFNPRTWAKLFSQAGAKYVVLTGKYHDGYALFPPKRTSSWNSMHVGPKRDLVGDVAKAVRAKGLKFGIHYSLYEWYNPEYAADKANGFLSQSYIASTLYPDQQKFVHDYKPSVIWSDGDWEANETYWKSKEFLAWLYNNSPIKDEVVVNDKWGIGTSCKHGDFYNCADHYNPEVLQQHKWENVFTMDKNSWGYRRDMALDDVITFPEILHKVVSSVSCGGNVLINIGATKEGTFAPVFQERLLSLGGWLTRNGEAIYGTSPWKYQKDSVHKNSSIWYTCLRDHYNASEPISPPKKLLDNTVLAIYAVILEKVIESNTVKLKNIARLLNDGQYSVQLLGEKTYLKWTIIDNVARVTLPHTYLGYPVLKISRNKYSDYGELERTKDKRNAINLTHKKSLLELLKEIVSKVSEGSNVLLNVGTNKSEVAPELQEQLNDLGDWIKRNGAALYESSPWIHKRDSIRNNSNIWYRCTKDNYTSTEPNDNNINNLSAVYAIILEELERNTVKLKDITDLLLSGEYEVQLLGEETYLNWNIFGREVHVTLPTTCPVYPVLKIIRDRNKYSLIYAFGHARMP